MSSRRILFLTNNPNLGSTARILQEWLPLAREQGLESRIIAPREGDFSRWLQKERFRFLLNPMPWPDKRRLPSFAHHLLRAAWWARRHGVDLIHCNEHDVYPFAAILGRMLNRPMVCHVRYLLSRGFAEWAFRGRKRPDALLWTSFQQRDDSLDAVRGLVPDERQHVVRLGISEPSLVSSASAGREFRESLGISAQEIVIGTASPLRPRKRVEDFVTLIREVAADNPHVVGLIAGGEVAGDESYRGVIVDRIAQANLGRRLQWIGNVEQVGPFHAACDVSVSTSEYETFGNSVCEAMACGCAVIGYAGGSVREVIGDAGLVVETGDLAGLIAAARRLAINAEERRDYGARASRRVEEQFDPKKGFEQIMSIYTKLLDK